MGVSSMKAYKVALVGLLALLLAPRADAAAAFAFLESQGPVVIRNSSGTEIGTSGAPIRVDPTGSTTQPVSAASLPLPSGASTSAKQPALGTAGTAATDVITVQGIASMTPLLATLSGTNNL